MTDGHDDERHRRIPACRRCRVRKIKCDRGTPKCSNCTKLSTACIIVDPVTSEQYPRDYIRRLEEREQELQVKLSSSETPTPPPLSAESGPGPTSNDTPQNGTPESLASTSSTARPNAFVGDGSGLSFLRHIFSNSKWECYKSQILKQLTERPQIPELSVSPNSQPPIEEASSLVENYLRGSHIQHTFLLRQHVWDIFRTIYHPTPSQPPTAQDYFQLYMVFSVGAVTRYRRGLSQEHPYGYFLAAQTYLGGIRLIGSLDAIQNLLLIARFGMYHHIGTSLWEISRFIMRQCIELGLHAPPRYPLSLLEEQRRRRIFWDSYVLDRFSSGVLGRPFAIAERDISVDFPLDAADETILASSEATSLAGVPIGSKTSPTELSTFISAIKLRRITSGIHSDFFHGRGVTRSGGDTSQTETSSGHVYVKLHHYLDELDAWRLATPIFQDPRALYERQEWSDFLMEKDKLLLIRGAIHRAPKRNGHPPKDLLAMCLKSATRVIELYNGMLQNNVITWTRSYFQAMFAAGLSIIHCVSIGVHEDGAYSPRNYQPAKTLAMCGNILKVFKREMPDAGRFAIVFEMLKENLLRDTGGLGMSKIGDINEDHLVHPTGSEVTSPRENNVQRNENLGGNLAILDPGDWDESLRGLPPNTTGHPIAPGDITQDQVTEFDMSWSMPDQDANLLAWPSLTTEMMQHLEAGMGEFAWGMMTEDMYSWDT